MWSLRHFFLLVAIAFSLLQYASAQPSLSQNSVASTTSTVPPTDPPADPKLGPKPGPTPGNSTLSPTQPVITIHGMCDSHPTASCGKVVTREEFEKLMSALNPEGQTISLKGQQNLARTYVEFLALEKAARDSGLEDTPEFRRVMNWMALRTAADLYRRNLQEKYRTPSPEDVHAYYQQHLSSYDRVKLARILVPRDDLSAKDKDDFDRKALNAANAAHARAVRGEDPTQIEKDAFASLGLSQPPPTELGTYGRANFTDKEGQEVFSLKAGEVSQVETEPRTYVIYKVISRETLTEDQVKVDIAKEISQQRIKDAIKAATDSAPAEFNEEYFGPGINTQLKAPPLPATPPH